MAARSLYALVGMDHHGFALVVVSAGMDAGAEALGWMPKPEETSPEVTK